MFVHSEGNWTGKRHFSVVALQSNIKLCNHQALLAGDRPGSASGKPEFSTYLSYDNPGRDTM